MDQRINERWLQFAFLNAKGNINKTALKFPFHTSLEVNQEVPITIADKVYMFTCVDKQTPLNHGDGSIDEIYVLATTHS